MSAEEAAPPPPIVRLRYVVGGVAVLAVAYFLVTGLVARHYLEQAKYDVDQLRQSLLGSDHAAAQRWMSQAQSNARSANSWVAGPAWALAADVPWFGRPARVERGLAAVAVTLAVDALPPAVLAGDDLTPSHLRDSNGAIRLSVFTSAAAPLAAAATAADDAAAAIARLPDSSWLPAANHARNSATALVAKLRRVLGDARDATALAPAMLGSDRPRRYLLVVENDAEARGLGGLPGVTAILTADRGKLSFGQFENNTFLNVAPASPPVSEEFRTTYAGTDVTTSFVDSDVSPDFPNVASLWLAMWQAKTGERLDGAIAADPTTLSYLLGATGPLTLPTGMKVGARNVVSLTEQKAYSRFSSLAARQAFFLSIAKAAASRIVDAAHGSAHELIKAMSRAVAEHRLVIFSADPAEQSTLETTPLAGGLPRTSAPFVGVVVNNGQGSKLDYYLQRTVTVDRTGCSSSGQQLSTVTVELHNAAPAHLPAYVTIQLGEGSHGPVGSERLFVAVYPTAGAQLLGVTNNGAAAFATVGSEEGHPRYEVDTTTDAGATTTLVFHLSEPRSQEPLEVWRQPGVNPEKVAVSGRRCG